MSDYEQNFIGIYNAANKSNIQQILFSLSHLQNTILVGLEVFTFTKMHSFLTTKVRTMSFEVSRYKNAGRKKSNLIGITLFSMNLGIIDKGLLFGATLYVQVCLWGRLKMREMKMRHQCERHENTRHESADNETARHEKARHENAGNENSGKVVFWFRSA